jgi:hypothetical protein
MLPRRSTLVRLSRQAAILAEPRRVELPRRAATLDLRSLVYHQADFIRPHWL